MMKFISWNCRGLGHPSKIASLKDLADHEKPGIIMIQETKQRLQEMTRIIEQLRHYEGQICEARGASGGITTMWNKNIWICTSNTINPYLIKFILEKKEEHKQIVIYNIYAPNHFRDKEQCWATLQEDIQAEDNRNIILGGDLNLILHSNEKRGGIFTHDPYRAKLEKIMQECDLVDIIPKNRRYTWNNRRLGRDNIMERLDRILVNTSFLSEFSTAHATILPYLASDHYPISIVLEAHCPLGPLPFKYNSLWRSNPIVDQIVKTTWQHHIEGSLGLIWECKLKNTKNALKKWVKQHYKEPENVKAELKNKLKENHRKIEENGLSHEDKALESDIYYQLYQVNREEE